MREVLAALSDTAMQASSPRVKRPSRRVFGPEWEN